MEYETPRLTFPTSHLPQHRESDPGLVAMAKARLTTRQSVSSDFTAIIRRRARRRRESHGPNGDTDHR